MAMQTTELGHFGTNGVKIAVKSALADLAVWFEGYARKRSRTDEIEALEALSDAQLAELGISRDRIVNYVFRDLMHV